MSEQEGNPGLVAGMTPEDFEDIDDEGLIDDPYQGIETYWCPLVMVGETNTFLRVVGDNGGTTNVEIRVPLEQMRHNGWTPPKETISERSRILEALEAAQKRIAELVAASKAMVKQLDNYQTIDDSGSNALPRLLEAIELAERSRADD